MGAEQKGNKQELSQVEIDVARIRPILEKDPDWPLASGQVSWENKEIYYRERNAVSRLTRKAVHELFPEYKVHVNRGRGTASNWIDVNFVIPGIEWSEVENIKQRTKNMLLSTGIQYGSFFPDSGPGDDWSPCPLVAVNHY